MSWSIFSCENFPKWDEENNCMTDYRSAFGIQIILRANQWTTLEDLYKVVRYESWIEDQGEGREYVFSGKQVAERLVGDFNSRGLVMADLDKITAEQKAECERQAHERNLKFRRMFVDRFEQQFRTKMQGGPGRWIPNTYEAECYKLLGLKPPDTVQKAPEQREAPTVIIQQPDPEMIAQLVSQQVALEMDKRTTGKTKG